MNAEVDRLYVIVDENLHLGLKCAQSCHALRQFVAEHPEIDQQWHEESNNLVVLQVENLSELADLLDEEGYAISRFHEPDLGNALTAIAVEPRAWRKLSWIRLAA